MLNLKTRPHYRLARITPSPSVLREKIEKARLRKLQKNFSTTNFLRVHNVRDIAYINLGSNNVVNLCSSAEQQILGIEEYTRNELSMFVIHDNMEDIFNKIDSTKKQLTSDNKLLDEDIIILNFLNPDKYYNKLRTLDLYESQGSDSMSSVYPDHMHLLDINRMFNSHEHYFSCYYGKLSVLLNNKDRFSQDDLENIHNIVRLLDKEYMIFKDVVDLFNLNRGYYYEAIQNRDVLTEELSKHDRIIELYYDYIGGIMYYDHDNLAYLGCLPFNQGFNFDSTLINNEEENLYLLKNLPLFNNRINNPYDYNTSSYVSGYDHCIIFDDIDFHHGNTIYYDQVLETHNRYELFSELPYHKIVNLDYEPLESEINLKGFSELPFNGLEDTDLDAEENRSGFSELPFNDLDDYLDNRSNFSELPFNDLDGQETPFLDALLEIAEELSNNF